MVKLFEWEKKLNDHKFYSLNKFRNKTVKFFFRLIYCLNKIISCLNILKMNSNHIYHETLIKHLGIIQDITEKLDLSIYKLENLSVNMQN